MVSGSSAEREGHTINVSAANGDAGKRLDHVIVLRLEGYSRSRVQALIKAGSVRRLGEIISDAGFRVKPGDIFEVNVPPPQPAYPVAQVIDLRVVFEDKHLIVIDKPAGLVVHPAPGHSKGTLVNALLAHCGETLSGIGGVKRPGIVHRLDKDTSGLLVVAKTDAAHKGLSEQFSSHGEDGRLRRAYLALVWGKPVQVRGVIDAAMSRSTSNRLKMAVVRTDRGRRAVTHYEVLERFPKGSAQPVASLLRLELETGRTHQIRVHLAHIGHPVLGDPSYGTGYKTSASKLDEKAKQAFAQLGRQALHAALLGFEHPVTGRTLVFESQLPPDIAELLAALRGEPAAPVLKRPRRTAP